MEEGHHRGLLDFFHCKHVFQEANFPADTLSKCSHMLEHAQHLYNFQQLPQETEGYIKLDKLGMVHCRPAILDPALGIPLLFASIMQKHGAETAAAVKSSMVFSFPCLQGHIKNINLSETGIQAMHRGGPFWGKVREAAEKKILKENLLAALSVQSGIQYDHTEEVMMAARHIADQRQSSSGAGPSHIPRSSDYASSSVPNRMICVEEDLDHIHHFQAYQVKHNQAVAEMLRTMEIHHGMNMDNFPTCPSYIPPRDKAVLDDDDDDGDDDDDEDEDEDDEE
ncbi:uncharacterized protein LOC129884386 [Solanum dulcamara]|uniref:uncharacterized protein LOC129884386 n=1 Tax=Solanum dulcamara TaxID=45834 RepID=UPI002485C306|nr:uncharacterized protein LOC129884386 [Solanum dulcamara]